MAREIKWRNALAADERLQERKKMKAAYKRGANEKKLPLKEPRDAPPETRCTWCRNYLAHRPRGIFTSNDKVVQLNAKEWAHYSCYITNESPTHAYGFSYYESSGGGRWVKRK